MDRDPATRRTTLIIAGVAAMAAYDWYRFPVGAAAAPAGRGYGRDPDRLKRTVTWPPHPSQETLGYIDLSTRGLVLPTRRCRRIEPLIRVLFACVLQWGVRRSAVTGGIWDGLWLQLWASEAIRRPRRPLPHPEFPAVRSRPRPQCLPVCPDLRRELDPRNAEVPAFRS